MNRRHFLTGAGGVIGISGLASVGWASEATKAEWWVPAEELPHQATFMQWPVSRTVHPNRVFLEILQQAIADVANSIAAYEPVIMLAAQADHRRARRLLGEGIELWDIPTEDLWARDSGPLFVRNSGGELAVRSLNFNGWGAKQVHRRDGKIAGRVAERLGLPLLNNGLVGEPGGVESDGEGTLLAHEASWVNANRNPGQSRGQIEAKLLEAFGASKVIWAKGIYGEDITDDHIDSRARFVAPGQILMQLPDENDRDPSDPWTTEPFKTRDAIARARDARGLPLKITTIPEAWDTRVRSADFVAAYVNYYVCNGAVISAQFGDQETDAIARDALVELYPDREVITLNVDPIGEVGGGIHCATQQMPMT